MTTKKIKTSSLPPFISTNEGLYLLGKFQEKALAATFSADVSEATEQALANQFRMISTRLETFAFYALRDAWSNVRNELAGAKEAFNEVCDGIRTMLQQELPST